MRVFLSILLLPLFLSVQGQPCYFLKDTGTVSNETSSSLVQLSDGTIYVCGSQGVGPFGSDDIALLKYDSCGNLLWQKFYGDSLANDAYYLNKTSDERLLISGQTGTLANGSDAFFYILDTSGTILLQKLYGDPLDQMLRYVEQTSDKGFVLCGYTSDAFGSNDTYVLKVDSAGIIQWDLVVGGPSAEYADQVHELPDSNFIITGDTKSFGSGATDVEVIKCNKNGVVIWDKYYGDNLDNGCQGLLLLSNGNYLSYGETNIVSSVAFDFYMEILDTAGTSLSRHTFGGTAADALFNLIELPGMQFICTGYSRSYNGFAAYDIVLFKVDSAGNMQWLKNIYSPGIDIGYKIIPSIHGGYLMTGLFDNNNGNYVLIHSDTIPNTGVGLKPAISEGNTLAFPNPCTDHFYLDASAEYIGLIDAEGTLVKSISNYQKGEPIGTGELPQGIYAVLVKKEGRLTGLLKISILR